MISSTTMDRSFIGLFAVGGYRDADASDVVQDVMRSVGMAIHRLEYEKHRGGFRAWLFTIARNKLSTFFEKRGRTEQAGGDTDSFHRLHETEQNRDDLEAGWELEHQRQVAKQALANVRSASDPKTWSAFEMTAMEEQTATQVANKLAMSAGAVYVARSRITARLRDEVSRLLQEEDG